VHRAYGCHAASQRRIGPPIQRESLSRAERVDPLTQFPNVHRFDDRQAAGQRPGLATLAFTRTTISCVAASILTATVNERTASCGVMLATRVPFSRPITQSGITHDPDEEYAFTPESVPLLGFSRHVSPSPN
jgi:hypothetical protein